MSSRTKEAPGGSSWVLVAAAGLRAAFGIIWTIDAYLKWQPSFAQNYVGYLQNAAQGQPDWLAPWFDFWLALVTPHVDFLVLATRLIETAIAIGLLLGLARRFTYALGFVFTLLIWSTAEGFGGPYTAGATDVGPALIYVLVFIALTVFARLLGSTPYSVDYYLERRFRAWGHLFELAPHGLWQRVPPRLPWGHQLAAVVAILTAIILSIGTLQSALSAPPATPANAAAAVSPLSIMSSQPVSRARDATLPPLLGTGDSVSVTLTITDATVDIASGVLFQAWTLGGTVPGPILHLREGQTLNVTLVNHGEMEHSIDFHAAEIDPSVNYRNVKPGETIQFSFVARTPGAFIYHCGTAPVLLHLGSGMYGVVVVDPKQELPHADVSYVIEQSEWYTHQVQGTVMAGDYKKMLAAAPDEVVFNGVAFQYKDNPLSAQVGQRVRFYFVNAGPNLTSAFHVIGGIFAAVYPDGDPAHVQTGVSTYNVAPGQGLVFDIIFNQPGKYPFVDHSMRDLMLGAVGVLNVTH